MLWTSKSNDSLVKIYLIVQKIHCMNTNLAEFPFYRVAAEINAQSAVVKMCVSWKAETMASSQRTVR
jgi:hypothetical protein